MSPRARPGPLPGDRVRELLARPPLGGWVPPPEPGDGSAAAGASSLDGRTAGAVDRPRPAGHGEVGPADDHETARAQAGHGSSRLAGLLPVALRTGRVDPGRRGAAALVVVALLAAVVAGGVVLRGRPQEVLLPEVVRSGTPLPGVPASPDPEATSDPQATVVVAVAGAVVRPGLVRLPAGSRVDDAVRAAGGLVDGASPGLLNLARRLVDGEQVLVGVEPPPGAPAPAGGGPAAPGGLLDLNTATAADLDALPGIGPVLAQRIVDWRTENERFASVDQLREVTGIGEAKYDDLKDEVTV